MRLTGESEKYGTRKKGVRKGLKKLLPRADPTGCSEVLKTCLKDVGASTAALNVS